MTSEWHSAPLTPENLASYDAVLIATDHTCIDYRCIGARTGWWWIPATSYPEGKLMPG
ncbi:MAG: hypothetical protein ABSA09_08070 [Desulfobaccales bacterium]|jgi:hypothetical protein